MKLNLRMLVYLNPSNVGKSTHRFNLEADSGFLLVKNSILALNKIEDWHFYVLVPYLDCWENKPENVTLVEYPYVNDALNSRFHFDSNAINNYFNVYKHDIDFIWSMLPEHVGGLKGVANKRREEIPVFTFINWMDYKENKGYEPSYKLRMLEGILDADIVGIQSEHMLRTMRGILEGYELPEEKMDIIPPKTDSVRCEASVGDIIGFPHRVSQESGFKEMFKLIGDKLKYPLWVSNINNNSIEKHPMLIDKCFDDRMEYHEQLKRLRFGVSYHVGYSMWSMSVLDMMSFGKVVLAPNMNAFPEMFDDDYPFLFEDRDDFLRKFDILQNCDSEYLLKWGRRNKEIVNERFTWEVQAERLSSLFYSAVSSKKVRHTEGVLDVIKDYNAISKTNIINKNISPFGRRCSRAWNKSRIELMRDYGVKDDMSSEHTVFYYDESRYLKNGIERVPKKVITPYEERLLEKKAEQICKDEIVL